MRICLAFELTTGYYEGILRGISIYARPRKPWIFQHIDVRGNGVAHLKTAAPDGVIAAVMNERTAAALNHKHYPVVNVGCAVKGFETPHVGNDDHNIGETAACHFLDRGFRHFAFIDLHHASFAHLREAGFRAEIERAGQRCLTYAGQPLQTWLHDLPRPTAVLALNDGCAYAVAEACREAGLRIPDDLAILGVDNQESLCRLSFPPLSSVAVDGERIGFCAAEMLDALITNNANPQAPVLHIKPLGVVTRQSTDLFATADVSVRDALRFISENAHQQLSVDDVLAQIPIARRTLEQRFRTLLGRSPADEIRRRHVERAKELLRSTDWPMPRIAAASGFSDSKQLTDVFRRTCGTTPMQFRRLDNF